MMLNSFFSKKVKVNFASLAAITKAEEIRKEDLDADRLGPEK